jgi:hypothetical protein
MSLLLKWSQIPAIFWVLWGAEAVFMLWWLLDDMKYQFLSVNPNIFIFWLYLLVALALYLLQFRIIALLMVGLGALPLLLMGLYIGLILIVSIFSGPIRWN